MPTWYSYMELIFFTDCGGRDSVGFDCSPSSRLCKKKKVEQKTGTTPLCPLLLSLATMEERKDSQYI